MTPMTLTLPAWRVRWGSERSPCAQCPATVELGQLEGVDVQQRAGLGPLIAPRGLRALAAALTRHAVALEDLPDRRAMPAREELQLHRPVVGPLARGSGSPARPRCSAPTGTTAAATSASADTRATPARPRWRACQRCHQRCAVAGATLRAAAACPQRRTLLDQHHQLKTALQSELAPTVLHVRSPSAGLSSQTAPSVGGRTPSQPFTKSVGRSARPADVGHRSSPSPS